MLTISALAASIKSRAARSVAACLPRHYMRDNAISPQSIIDFYRPREPPLRARVEAVDEARRCHIDDSLISEMLTAAGKLNT